MSSIRLAVLAIGLTVVLGITGCRQDNGTNADSNSSVTTCSNDQVVTLEQQISTTLDNIDSDVPFTLTVKAADGKTYVHSVGASSDRTSYASASSSKLVTAVVILSLVENGSLTLDDHPQQYISGWPTTGNLADITLHQLLDFTAGLSEEPVCLNNPLADFNNCVLNIADANEGAETPGSSFYYSSSHLQVAGLMAIKAAGLDNWGDLFSQFQSASGLFSHASYDLPSTGNPRLAGGMHWQAFEYRDFLQALYQQTILTPTLITALSSDQLGSADIAYSPAQQTGEDWHYGYGVWIECHFSSYNCTSTTRISSAGSYGAYPFIDYQYGYYGILARQGPLKSFVDGYQIFQSVATNLADWAQISCYSQNP